MEPYFNNKQLALTGSLYSNFTDPASVNYETEDLGLGIKAQFLFQTILIYRQDTRFLLLKLRQILMLQLMRGCLQGLIQIQL